MRVIGDRSAIRMRLVIVSQAIQYPTAPKSFRGRLAAAQAGDKRSSYDISGRFCALTGTSTACKRLSGITVFGLDHALRSVINYPFLSQSASLYAYYVS
jgi:hypothetical protein